LLIISSDVTEKKQLEAESLRMQRMEAVGALAGGMAHDLNNALAPILMGTQLLRRDSKDENTKRVLSLMESSTRRGADMVRQVLLFARGQAGRVRAAWKFARW
jgi:two-component system cell cycle sensor histidine kinase/response regulator CckA